MSSVIDHYEDILTTMVELKSGDSKCTSHKRAMESLDFIIGPMPWERCVSTAVQLNLKYTCSNFGFVHLFQDDCTWNESCFVKIIYDLRALEIVNIANLVVCFAVC